MWEIKTGSGYTGDYVYVFDGKTDEFVEFRAAKRIYGIPNFRYYALADGLKAILNKVRMGFNFSQAPKPPPSSEPLFDF